MNYEDNMSFEDECKVVLEVWRNRNTPLDPPPEIKSEAKPKFVSSMLLLKKAVLALRQDEGRGVQTRNRNCDTACM